MVEPAGNPGKKDGGDARIVRAGDVELCIEAFGDPSHPALLLIQGANTSMIGYPEALCRRLAAAGLYVIRYDHRDTGQSSTFPAKAPGYTVVDLAADAVGILDACGLVRVHAAGFSTGGMVVQHLAFLHGDRLRTATIGGSSPEPVGADPAAIPEAERLPLPLPKVARMAAVEATIDYDDAEAAVAAWREEYATLQGNGDVFDPVAVEAFARREIARARSVPSLRLNHPIAVAATPRWRHRLGGIAVPTLVLHGTDDPLLPQVHGETIARAIPGARLTVMEGMGHILAPASHYWDRAADAIIAHTT
jgi:pimeloyl-ACP methyl ester carboxylesterase